MATRGSRHREKSIHRARSEPLCLPRWKKLQVFINLDLWQMPYKSLNTMHTFLPWWICESNVACRVEMGSQVIGSTYLVGCGSVCQIRFHSRKTFIVMLFLFAQSFTMLAGWREGHSAQSSLGYLQGFGHTRDDLGKNGWLNKTRSTIGVSSGRSRITSGDPLHHLVTQLTH